MTKQHFASFLILFVVNLVVSQEFSLSGQLIDESAQPISYANILLLKSADSTVYKGTSSSEKGQFLFSEITSGVYDLHITFVGFENYRATLNIEEDIILQPIVLRETAETLNEVQIIAQKPTLKKEQDRLVFNIENTALTEGSIWDVLRGTPGVLMINDEITVKNSGNVIYLINGRRVYLNDQEIQQLLSGTNANAVQQVEVITNPSAKYDASGGAVINIKMSKNLVAGYNGNIYGNYTQGIYPRYNVGTGHFFKGEKLSTYLNYSYDQIKLNRIYNEDIVFVENGAPVGGWHIDRDQNTKSQTHNTQFNMDYEMNDKNTLSFSASGTLTPYWKRKATSNTQAMDSTFNSTNFLEDKSNNWSFNLGYQNTNAKENTLSTNFSYTLNDYERVQDVLTNYYDAFGNFTRSNSFNTLAKQDIDIFTGQIDYTIPFKDESELEFGAKVSTISSDNDFSQDLSNTGLSFSSEDAGIFNYDEEIFAAYIHYAKNWEKWDLSLGIRGEQTEGTGELVNVETNDFNYFELFPTFNVTHHFNDKHSLGLSYNKRIERPAYNTLNPFQFYLSDNSYIVGNPNLKPTLSQLLTLSYTLNQTFTFELYYRYEENTIAQLTLVDNDANIYRYQASNLKEEVDYGFDFMTYVSLTDFWSLYVLNSIFHDEAKFYAEESGNAVLSNERWSMFNNVVNYFSLGNNFDGQLSFLYISPVVQGSAEASSRTQVDLNFKKTFKDGKWVLSLAFNDIFSMTDFSLKNNYLNQNNRYYAKFDNRTVRLGLRYNFGNTKLKVNSSLPSSQAEQERIQTQD